MDRGRLDSGRKKPDWAILVAPLLEASRRAGTDEDKRERRVTIGKVKNSKG